MNTIGRRSVASFIGLVLGLSWMVLVAGLLLTVCITIALPFMRDPTMTVMVPVSFSMDAPASVRVGRSGFGFEILDRNEAAARDTRGRFESVDGSLRVPTSSRVFIAANALILMVMLASRSTWSASSGACSGHSAPGSPFPPGMQYVSGTWQAQSSSASWRARQSSSLKTTTR
jgi:hypothetical protein